MTTVALLGAGGKMGMRLSANLQGSRFETKHFEISDAGIGRLKNELGIDPVPQEKEDETLKAADVVIFALPDTLIGKIAHQVVPKLKPGAMAVILDAAAPFAGHLPEREDVVYFITHPCHPVIFNKELNKDALEDHFGGIHAAQSVVNTLLQGPEEAYALGEEISKTIYQPIKKALPCHPSSNGHARARIVRNRLCHNVSRHETGNGYRGGIRCRKRMCPRLLAGPHEHSGSGDV